MARYAVRERAHSNVPSIADHATSVSEELPIDMPSSQARTLPVCWVISDGAAGNHRQAEALAAALPVHGQSLQVRLRQPWAVAAPHLTVAAARGIVDNDGRPLRPPWPDMAIGCGRRAALAVRMLRRWSAGASYGVQILDPQVDSAHFDLVVTPQHDRLHGSNVIHTLGSLHPVNATWLAEGRAAFTHLGELPAPRTAVLVGASNRAQTLDDDYFRRMLTHMHALRRRDGGSFMLSTSRRTSAAMTQLLKSGMAELGGMFWSPQQGDANPYAGMLGWAQRIIVTPDSVNMLSEACATTASVHTLVTQPLRGKLASFHAALRDAGRLHDIDAPLSPASPLLETAAVAAQVLARWQVHANRHAAC